MKMNASVISSMLMAIAAIALIIAGISEASIAFISGGVLFFLAILIKRGRETRKLNNEINDMEEKIENEISNSDNK